MADNKSREVVGTGKSVNGDHYVEYSDGTREWALGEKWSPFEYSGEDNEVRPADEGEGNAHISTSPNLTVRPSKGGDITIKVTADMAEAITGFKALQRELRETTKALREYEAVVEGGEFTSNFGLTTWRDTLDADTVKNTSEKKIPDTVAAMTGEGTFTTFDLSEVPTEELHEELVKREGGSKKDVPRYAHYLSVIKRLVGEGNYRHMSANTALYEAYHDRQYTRTVWTDRGNGATTSAIALVYANPRTILVVSSRACRDRLREEFDTRRIYTASELGRGSEVIRDNDVFIFDDETPLDREVLKPALSMCQAQGKRVIKIRAIDYLD